MYDYYEKERESQKNKGSIQFTLVSCGLMVSFIPVAFIVVGYMQAYKKIRGVLINE